MTAVLFLVLGILPVGHNMLVYLESGYEQRELPDKINGILVLGGFFDTKVSGVPDVPALNSNGDRVVEGMRLGLKYPAAMLVFSGGNGYFSDVGYTETEVVEKFLKSFNYPEVGVIFEEESRNTYENIKFSLDYVRPSYGEKWLLVTSAYHMRRAMAVAKTADWNLIPHPVDYRTDGKYHLWPRSFNVTSRFHEFELAGKEFVGYLVYKLTGKISLLD